MIIILEGPDGAGKTTLADQLLNSLQYGVRIHHHGSYLSCTPNEIQNAYFRSIYDASPTIIMDRSWLSEPIYADVVRKSPSRLSSNHVRELELAASARGVLVVNCRPPLSTCIKKEDEYVDTNQLKLIYNMYESLPTLLPVINYNWQQRGSYDELSEHLHRIRTGFR